MKPRKSLILPGILFLCALLSGPVSYSEEAQETAAVSVPSEVESVKSVITADSQGPAADEMPPARILTLNECIEIAVKNNLPLKTVKKSLKLAEFRVWESRRSMLPKVTVNWQEYTGKIYGRRFYGKKEGVDIQQTMFHGGEFFYTMKQAETNLKIVNREYARLKNELVLQVRKAFHSLAKAKENLKTQQELWHDGSRIHEMVVKEYESGVTSSLEMLNVNSQINQLRFQVISAKGDIEVAELILKQAMNVEVGENIEIEYVPEFRKIDVNFEELLPQAMANRPEMQINTLLIQYYTYGLKVAKSKSWPKIDLLGSFGLAKEEYIAKDQNTDPAAGAVDVDQKLNQQWYAGVKCSVPMWGSTTEYSYVKEVWVPVVSAYHGTETITNSVKFNFLDNLAQYSDKYLADVDLDKAKQELIKSRQDITLELKESCFSYEKALMQLDTAINKVKYQETDLEFVKFKRQMDEVQDSNVMESMIKLAQEKFGYMQAITDCNISLAAVCKAVGIEDYFDNNKK